MLNSDLLGIEREAVRQATGILTAANEALESDVQRDRLMADILGFLLGGKSGGDD